MSEICARRHHCKDVIRDVYRVTGLCYQEIDAARAEVHRRAKQAAEILISKRKIERNEGV